VELEGSKSRKLQSSTNQKRNGTQVRHETSKRHSLHHAKLNVPLTADAAIARAHQRTRALGQVNHDCIQERRVWRTHKNRRFCTLDVTSFHNNSHTAHHPHRQRYLTDEQLQRPFPIDLQCFFVWVGWEEEEQNL